MGNKNKSFVKFDGGKGGGNVNFNSQLKSNESTTIGFSSFGLATPISSSFISTWRTTTASETITLPYQATGTYSGTIDWGDGSLLSVNDYANRTHTYAISGDYIITITGVTTGFRFNNTGNKTKIRSIQNWGTLNLGNSGFYFYGCSNLDLSSVIGILDLTGTKTFIGIFANCSSLTTINNINSWDTSLVTNMGSMFDGCTAFNQPLNFNTSSVTNMASMFNNATAFNQNIGSWNVALVTNFSSFMAGKTPATFSTTNLDAIYNGWVIVQSSRTISFGTAKYSASGVSGKAYLTGTKLWTITDGGL